MDDNKPLHHTHLQPVIVVWDKNGKFFQNWTADFKNGDGIEHGKRIAAQFGGTYQVLPSESAYASRKTEKQP